MRMHICTPFYRDFPYFARKNWKPDHGFVAKMQIFGDAFTARVYQDIRMIKRSERYPLTNNIQRALINIPGDGIFNAYKYKYHIHEEFLV